MRPDHDFTIAPRGSISYRERTHVQIHQANALERLWLLPAASVDFIFADPPYFLSRKRGTTCRGGQRVAVRKGRWDEPTTPEQQRAFGLLWLAAARRLLKSSGSLMVSGTSHSIHDIATAAVGGLGMDIVNEIVWEKPNPPPNLACRSFTHASETILWLRPSPRHKHFFNYAAIREANGGKQQRSVWRILPPSKTEKSRGGGHPTQKPEALLERCLLAACPPRGVVLDPFAGSGTTGVAAVAHRAAGVVLVELDPEFVLVELARLGAGAGEGRAAA
jgi:site-specific DNA-methyltransferase (adenine-specific)